MSRMCLFSACAGPRASLARILFIASSAAQACLPLRRSVHAHVIFWIHDDDAEEACSKIRSCMPAEWNPEGDGGLDANKERIAGAWIPPTERLHLRLFRAAKRKERHECKPVGQPGCRQKGADCAGHFPQPVQSEKAPLEDPDNFCFRYYCPGHEHRNVVPYVPVSPASAVPPAVFSRCARTVFGCSATSCAPVPTLPGAAAAIQFSSEHAEGDRDELELLPAQVCPEGGCHGVLPPRFRDLDPAGSTQIQGGAGRSEHIVC